MPADRYNNIANSTRPLMPSLASNRTAKTPIAPRLATSITPSSSTSSRRTLYDSGASTGANTTPKSVSREDLSTPVKAFISSNITPRSSSRKSRVDSRESTPSGTPSGTPTPSRPASFIDTQAAYESHAALSGLGLSNVPVKGPKSLTNGTTVSHVPSSTRVLPNSTHTAVCSDTATREDPQKFFHANSVRLQEPSQGQKKVPTFFYANGQSETKPRILSVPSPPLSSTSQGPFLHTDDVPEERKPVSSILTGSPESSLSMSSHPLSPAFRPPSPAKENILLSDRKGASQVIRSHQHRPSAVHMISGRLHTMSTTETDTVQRNTSIASATKPRRGNHAKSASLSSIDSTPRKHYHRSFSI
ncbi:hypothetical protein M501DRAFT_598674 [Patellaria atrata CBS 101060]|uniref:Uncharacterized protein n=1 Tax=Patellaria atrata CBS 101060 TaxID=1346257 RepID=A0A9P4S2P4_9PEZI|nr:hypothetical protein M501DRAFT_598674 [Patellaria atrata CBS 101060]